MDEERQVSKKGFLELLQWHCNMLIMITSFIVRMKKAIKKCTA